MLITFQKIEEGLAQIELKHQSKKKKKKIILWVL